MSFGIRRPPLLPLLKNDVVMYTCPPQTRSTRSIFETFIQVCELAVSWVTRAEAESCQMRGMRCGLTFEVDFLGLDLGYNVHGDLVELELQGLDILRDRLDGRRVRLLIQLRVAVRDQEVNLLRLAVQLLPADVHIDHASVSETDLGRRLLLDGFDRLLALFHLSTQASHIRQSSYLP